ncbi:hypothetical protein ACMGD3_23925 [Lysinibacillus sphaericus]|uniref:hypothetical protein n=1 Tax=Lysinibacillus sphaericus TaxID=1421 RepID=UPI003F79A1EB
MSVLINILGLHITGGLLWFVFYMGHMLTNSSQRKIFNTLVKNGTSQKHSANYVRGMLLLTALTASLLYWEVSAIRTFKKSYKNFLPKK